MGLCCRIPTPTEAKRYFEFLMLRLALFSHLEQWHPEIYTLWSRPDPQKLSRATLFSMMLLALKKATKCLCHQKKELESGKIFKLILKKP